MDYELSTKTEKLKTEVEDTKSDLKVIAKQISSQVDRIRKKEAELELIKSSGNEEIITLLDKSLKYHEKMLEQDKSKEDRAKMFLEEQEKELSRYSSI